MEVGGGGRGEREKYCRGLECFDFKFPPLRGKSCGALTGKISRETTQDFRRGKGDNKQSSREVTEAV